VCTSAHLCARRNSTRTSGSRACTCLHSSPSSSRQCSTCACDEAHCYADMLTVVGVERFIFIIEDAFQAAKTWTWGHIGVRAVWLAHVLLAVQRVCMRVYAWQCERLCCHAVPDNNRKPFDVCLLFDIIEQRHADARRRNLTDYYRARTHVRTRVHVRRAR
jgi:hypothetical protein